MSKIIPFSAVRPTPDKVSLVTTRSYDEYSSAELASQLDFNPFSFLHILNPIYATQQKDSLERRCKLVAKKFDDFKSDSVFMTDDYAAFYLYEIQTKDCNFTGIIAGTSIVDYKQNIIKKHEDTLQYRVEIFKDYLHQTGFNTEPVLMTYKDDAELNAWINFKKQQPRIYEFSTKKKEKHLLWKIQHQPEIEYIQNKFEEIGNLYLADGHHRTASAELLFDEYKNAGNENLKYFMSFLIPESNVKIYEFNRIIRDLNNHSKDEFIDLISQSFWVKNKAQELWKPTKKFEFGMYLDNEFYSLTLKDTNNFTSVLESLVFSVLIFIK